MPENSATPALVSNGEYVLIRINMPRIFTKKFQIFPVNIEEAVVFPDFPAGIRRFAPGLPPLRRQGGFIVQNALAETTIQCYIKRISTLKSQPQQ